MENKYIKGEEISSMKSKCCLVMVIVLLCGYNEATGMRPNGVAEHHPPRGFNVALGQAIGGVMRFTDSLYPNGRFPGFDDFFLAGGLTVIELGAAAAGLAGGASEVVYGIPGFGLAVFSALTTLAANAVSRERVPYDLTRAQLEFCGSAFINGITNIGEGVKRVCYAVVDICIFTAGLVKNSCQSIWNNCCKIVDCIKEAWSRPRAGSTVAERSDDSSSSD